MAIGNITEEEFAKALRAVNVTECLIENRRRNLERRRGLKLKKAGKIESMLQRISDPTSREDLISVLHINKGKLEMIECELEFLTSVEGVLCL